MDFLFSIFWLLIATFRDVLPVMGLLIGFQLLVLRKPLPNWRQIAAGFGFVLLGLTLFLAGLEQALFPLGRLMAEQLTDPQFLFGAAEAPPIILWHDYLWVYVFGAAVGFATTIAEPSLIAVAYKASEASGGAIKEWPLRVAVAIGVAAGIGVGTFRIVTGTPLFVYILAGYVIVVIQTFFAPRSIVPLAYDSGGVSTSTVTVPLVAALGLGLSMNIPGRDPLTDGFGLIAFACLFPIITVMAYAQLAGRAGRRRSRPKEK